MDFTPSPRVEALRQTLRDFMRNELWRRTPLSALETACKRSPGRWHTIKETECSTA